MAATACVSSVMVRMLADLEPQAEVRILADDTLVRSRDQGDCEDRHEADQALVQTHMVVVDAVVGFLHGIGGRV
eukprot:5921461-Alexandrium_andersonii.AAC.1